MKRFDYLIIGGGIAGTTAAEEIRQRDPNSSICIVTEEPERLYSRVLLPHYLRNQKTLEQVYLRRPEWYEAQDISLAGGVRAETVNTDKKWVRLSDGRDVEYGKLLIATGGKVKRLDVPGGDLRGVTYLRTIHDAQDVASLMRGAKRGVVIGSGFISIEYAQSFMRAGMQTTCAIREPYFWSGFLGKNSGKLISDILERNGVQILSEEEVESFEGTGNVRSMRFRSGKTLPADIVGVGIGIYSETDHLKNTPLAIGRGAIANEYLETNVENVWVAGDLAEFYDVLFQRRHQLGNWSNARAQGRVAGINMLAGWGRSASSERETYKTISAYSISLFDTPFTFLGDPVEDKGMEFIERGSVEEGRLLRFHIRNNVLVGASLINCAGDRALLSEAITARQNVGTIKDQLARSTADLRALLAGGPVSVV